MSNLTIDNELEINKTNSAYTLSDGTNTVTIISPIISTDSEFILPITGGNTGNVLIWNSTGDLRWDVIGGNRNYWLICDIKASGTNGGTFTSGAWRTRDLTTLTKPSGIGTDVQLAVSPATTNQILIQPGTYRIFCQAPSLGVQLHKAKLRNITDATDELIGTSERNIQASNNSYISSFITVITTQKVFEIQHQCSSTRVIDGFGRATSISGIDEIYTCVFIEKI